MKRILFSIIIIFLLSTPSRSETPMKVNFLFGRITSGNFLVKLDEITEKFGLPKSKISNDMIVQYIQTFSKYDDNGYSFYSGYFSKILNKNIISPKPIYEEIELLNQGVLEGGNYIRLVFDFTNTPKVTLEDIEIIKRKFPLDFTEVLGLNFLDVR